MAAEPCYIQAVHNLPVVAKCTAQLLDFMMANGIFTLDDLHVIGFSLGAQTAGMISNYIKTGKLRRITGIYRNLRIILKEEKKKNNRNYLFISKSFEALDPAKPM